MAVENPICECCSIRPAKLVVVRRRRDDTYRTFVCCECAEELTRVYVKNGLDLDGMVLGMDRGAGSDTAYSCRLCGTTLADIVVGGRPGCCACYGKFGGEIENAIKVAQGHTLHMGKTPER
ncbi:MAG: hypothetical protein NT018_00230 [Armatimonadetes bacterium]|nr:hypothetical protein [Armatimonadota bacterium]